MKRIIVDASGETMAIAAAALEPPTWTSSGERVDFAPPEAMMQCAAIRLDTGASIKPHVHAQPETWVILRGGLRVRTYDDKGNFLRELILVQGDVLITLRGGHSFADAIADTILLEVKAGPYEGRTHTYFEEKET